MSQNDLVIDNQSFPATRSDINSALQALGSLNSGPSAPATTYANMLWYDTANNILKMRSEADDAWIDLGTLDQSANTFTPAGLTNLTQAQAEDDTSTVFGQVSGQRLAQAGVVSFTDQEQQVGVGQTFQDVAGSRSGNTVYQNTTGKPIYVFVELSQSTVNYFQVSNDGSSFIEIQRGDGGAPMGVGTVVPDGAYYRVMGSFGEWMELR